MFEGEDLLISMLSTALEVLFLTKRVLCIERVLTETLSLAKTPYRTLFSKKGFSEANGSG